MFHKLGVTVRLLSLLAILIVVVQKRKSRMVPLLVHLFKVEHQLIEARIFNGGVRWKKLLESLVFHSQKLFLAMLTGIEKFNVTVYSIAMDIKYLTYFPVAKSINVKG